MSTDNFDLNAWLHRIGYTGPREPTLKTLAGLITAHSSTIPFENIDVLLGRVPKLDLASLQDKLITAGRGGYCFEQNAILRAGLHALGFTVTSLIGRVIRGLEDGAERPASHMALRVDLPDGAYLVDVGFGNLTPTAPLAMRAGLEQQTPHEPMRFMPWGDELLLQAQLGAAWHNVYRLSPRPPMNTDYEVANWFTATHPASPFVANMIVARPGPHGERRTFLNGRLGIRQPSQAVVRQILADAAATTPALAAMFGLSLSTTDITACLAALDANGTRGAEHPSFR